MGTCTCRGYQTCPWGWGVAGYDGQGAFVRRPVTREEIADCVDLEEDDLVRGLDGPGGKVEYCQGKGVPGDYIVTFSADGKHMHAWLAIKKQDAEGGSDHGSLLRAEGPVALWARANKLAGSFRLWQRDAGERGRLVLKSIREWEGGEGEPMPGERAAGGAPDGSPGGLVGPQEAEG